MNQTAIPCILMRGGTSKGPFSLAHDLPADPARRDAVLLAAMGSPDVRQIDGVGGADSLTSKVAIVGPPTHPDADVDITAMRTTVHARLRSNIRPGSSRSRWRSSPVRPGRASSARRCYARRAR